MLSGHATQSPQCVLQPLGKRHPALAPEDDFHMPPARIGQCKLIQTMLEQLDAHAHLQLACVGEIAKP